MDLSQLKSIPAVLTHLYFHTCDLSLKLAAFFFNLVCSVAMVTFVYHMHACASEDVVFTSVYYDMCHINIIISGPVCMAVVK